MNWSGHGKPIHFVWDPATLLEAGIVDQLQNDPMMCSLVIYEGPGFPGPGDSLTVTAAVNHSGPPPTQTGNGNLTT